MSDWKPGDLALCVKGGTSTQAGAVYTVAGVYWSRRIKETGAPGEVLTFRERLHLEEHRRRKCWSARFRKIEPHEEDDEDRATIALYKRTPEPADRHEFDKAYFEIIKRGVTTWKPNKSADLQQVGASSRWVETPSPNGSLPTGGAPITENGASP